MLLVMRVLSLIVGIVIVNVAFGQTVRFLDRGEALKVDVPFSRGVSIIDYNNDGLEDLFITRKGRNNCLFKNLGDGTFEEVGYQANVGYIGVSNFATWADFNNDGWTDFYLATSTGEPNKLYRNKGDDTFEEFVEATETRIIAHTIAAIWGDVNHDGWLDLYVVNLNQDNIFLMNNGDGTFSDITAQSGLYGLRLSMGTVFIDYDGDNDLDIYASHDGPGNLLFNNDGTGHFTEVSAQAGLNTKSQAMGVAVGDFNNDTWPDIYLTNLYHNDLFKNNGDGTFTEISSSAGIEDEGMGWGVSWLDYDNDGWLDLYVANDSEYSDYSNALFRNNGDETFTRVGLESEVESNGATYGTSTGDVNRDGKLDILISNQGKTDVAQLFINAATNNNRWLRLKLIGTKSNHSAIGASVVAQTQDKIWSRTVTSGGSWAADDSKWVHFGVGEKQWIEKLTVVWPDGGKEEFSNVPTNKAFSITEGQGIELTEYDILSMTGEEIVTGLHIDKHENEAIKITMVGQNPFTDEAILNIKSSDFKSLKISALNSNGLPIKRLLTHKISEGEHRVKWDGKNQAGLDLPSGLYLISVTSRNFHKTLKVIKQ